MGVNEIHDGRQSLLTQRLENLRRVKRQENEGQGGGGGNAFQQVFDFEEKEEERKDKSKDTYTPDAHLLPYAPPRAVKPDEEKPSNKQDKLQPGSLIDLEA